jgi:hypothetical protein
LGLEDWSMYPLLPPGSLVAIDGKRRRVAVGGWTSEYDRPIYFLEHRAGYVCGWCALSDGRLVLQPHPASGVEPRVFELNSIDIVGQVVGAAMPLTARAPRPNPTTPAEFPNP